jgi:spore germination cell wall hydrolase CwlJ-like protein
MNELRQLLLTIPDDLVLALNGYFEARGDWRNYGDLSLIAVMAVVMNRSSHPNLWQNSIPEVVAAHRQFSWTNWDEKIQDPQYPKALTMAQTPEGDYGQAWQRCRQLSAQVLAGQAKNPVANATYYYNPHVSSPSWADNFVEVRTIGNHRFMADPEKDPEVLWDAPREEA